MRRIAEATGLSVEEIKKPSNQKNLTNRSFSFKTLNPLEMGSENETVLSWTLKISFSFFSQSDPFSSVFHHRELAVKVLVSENDKSHGSLFLRIGATIFSVGTLIYTGLEFLTFFELPEDCESKNILLAINPVLYMIFVSMQMYLIFNHPRLNLQHHKVGEKDGFFSFYKLQCHESPLNYSLWNQLYTENTIFQISFNLKSSIHQLA